jgi:hypothetical protein
LSIGINVSVGKVPERAALHSAVHGAHRETAHEASMIGQTFGMSAARTIHHPVDAPPLPVVRVVGGSQKPAVEDDIDPFRDKRTAIAGASNQPNGGGWTRKQRRGG